MIHKILIIEDEKPNSARLTRLITTLRPQAKILEVLESVAESIQWLTNNPLPDLIMMDVRLADGNSFEILERVTVKCPIVFTTAYDEYAVRAFKFNSIDYLLKPVEQDELEKALKKVEETRHIDTISIENLLDHISRKEYRTRFLLPYRDGFKTLFTSEIEYIISESRITRAKLFNGNEEVIPQTLEELEQQLDPKQFFRANRQFIIHVDAIRNLHNHFNGKLVVELKKDASIEVIVSREKSTLLKNWLDF